MKCKMKKIITILCFQIGVNVIGIPEIYKHYISTFWYKKKQSKFY